MNRKTQTSSSERKNSFCALALTCLVAIGLTSCNPNPSLRDVSVIVIKGPNQFERVHPNLAFVNHTPFRVEWRVDDLPSGAFVTLHDEYSVPAPPNACRARRITPNASGLYSAEIETYFGFNSFVIAVCETSGIAILKERFSVIGGGSVPDGDFSPRSATAAITRNALTSFVFDTADQLLQTTNACLKDGLVNGEFLPADTDAKVQSARFNGPFLVALEPHPGELFIQIALEDFRLDVEQKSPPHCDAHITTNRPGNRLDLVMRLDQDADANGKLDIDRDGVQMIGDLEIDIESLGCQILSFLFGNEADKATRRILPSLIPVLLGEKNLSAPAEDPIKLPESCRNLLHFATEDGLLGEAINITFDAETCGKADDPGGPSGPESKPFELPGKIEYRFTEAVESDAALTYGLDFAFTTTEPDPESPDLPASYHWGGAAPQYTETTPVCGRPYDLAASVSTSTINQSLKVATESGLLSFKGENKTVGIHQYKTRPSVAPILTIREDQGGPLGSLLVENLWVEYELETRPGAIHRFAVDFVLPFDLQVDVASHSISPKVRLPVERPKITILRSDTRDDPTSIANVVAEALIPHLETIVVPIQIPTVCTSDEAPIPVRVDLQPIEITTQGEHFAFYLKQFDGVLLDLDPCGTLVATRNQPLSIAVSALHPKPEQKINLTVTPYPSSSELQWNPDTRVGTFRWTPTSQDFGTRDFLFTACEAGVSPPRCVSETAHVVVN